MIIRSGTRQVLSGGGFEYAIFATFPVDEVAPVSSLTLDAGYGVIANSSRVSIDAGDLVGTEDNTTPNSAVDFSVNDGSAMTIADGDWCVFDRKGFASSAQGVGFDPVVGAIASYPSLNLGTNGAVTLFDNSKVYNFSAAVFGANVAVGYQFVDGKTIVLTRTAGTWIRRIILPSTLVGSSYYAKVQLTYGLASGTTRLKQFAMRRDLTDTVSSVSCGTTAGSTADAPSADGVDYIALTTAPSAGTFKYILRKAGVGDYWAVEIEGSGNIYLKEYVSGSPTTRQSDTGGFVASGQPLIIATDDETMHVWYGANGTKRLTHTGAASSKTATGRELASLGTGGVVGEISLYTRYPSGAELTALDTMRE